MDAKFSASVKDIISFSREEAIANNNDYIGSEHLLLGILHGRQQCYAIMALTYLGIDITQLRNNILKETPQTIPPDNNGSIPLTKQAEKALKATYLEAEILKAKEINSFHLLLALIRNADSIASQVLNTFNVNYDSLLKLSEDSIFFEKISRFESPVTEEISFEEKYLDISRYQESTLPLSLIFDTSEYSAEDIKEILSLLSELYRSIGGDYLKINGMNQFECLTKLDIA